MKRKCEKDVEMPGDGANPRLPVNYHTARILRALDPLPKSERCESQPQETQGSGFWYHATV